MLKKINFDKIPKTIVLTGNNNVGKSTISKVLQKIIFEESLKYNLCTSYLIKPFAENPRNFICDMLNIKNEDFDKLKREKGDFRSTFINFCETCKRIYGEDFFVKPILKLNEKYLTIIPDLRFDIEYENIRKLENHIIIGVVNNENEKTPQPYDTLFINDKSLGKENLKEKLKELLIKTTN